MEPWIPVAEYARITGRTPQSVYRSIKRGTVESMVDDAGNTLVSSCGLQPDPEPGTIPDTIPVYKPVEQPGTIPVDNPVESPPEPQQAAMVPVYSQEYVDLLKEQIESLKSDKEYLKQALAAALMPPKPDTIPVDMPDDIPVEQPVDKPVEYPVEPPKLSRWQHLKAFFKGE